MADKKIIEAYADESSLKVIYNLFKNSGFNFLCQY